jgi:hypothetical protein
MFAKRINPKPMKLPVKYSKLSQINRRLVREEYIRMQNGMCYHCECALAGEPSDKIPKLDVDSDLFPSGFFNHPVHLHHDHNTDMTIGAVHAHCNAVLWEYEGE